MRLRSGPAWLAIALGSGCGISLHHPVDGASSFDFYYMVGSTFGLKLDEASGATSFTAVTGETGTCGSCVTGVSGARGGRAVRLDYTANLFIDFGNPGPIVLPGLSARSMCAWGRPTTFASANFNYAWLASYGTDTGLGSCFFLGRHNGDLDAGGNGDSIVSAGFWVLNQWKHACVTYDGATARLYGDGALLVSQAKSWSLTGGNLWIGRNTNGLNEYWSGDVDEVMIWSRALTEQEVADIYAHGLP